MIETALQSISVGRPFVVRLAAIVAASLSLPVLAFGLLYVAGACMEAAIPTKVDQAFASREDAESHNLFGRGWMPRDMPATMNQIRIRTDVDLNLAWATFITDEIGMQEIRSRFAAINGRDTTPPARVNVDWWPDELKNERQLRKTTRELYACGNRSGFQEPAFLALDPKTREVYYWLR